MVFLVNDQTPKSEYVRTIRSGRRSTQDQRGRVEQFFPAGGGGRGIPTPRRRRDERLWREGAPRTAWGNPPTGPERLDSHEFDYPCGIQRRIRWAV